MNERINDLNKDMAENIENKDSDSIKYLQKKISNHLNN